MRFFSFRKVIKGSTDNNSENSVCFTHAAHDDVWFTKKKRIPHLHSQENVSDRMTHGRVYQQRSKFQPPLKTKRLSCRAEKRLTDTREEIKSWNQGRITDPPLERYMSGSLCNISLWKRAEHRKLPRSHALLHRPCISAHEYTTASLGDRQQSKRTCAHTHIHTGKIDTLMWLRRPVLHRGQRHAVHTQ